MPEVPADSSGPFDDRSAALEDHVHLRLCFVCLGNICRSPTAEGIMLALVEEAGLRSHVSVDSAGTSAYHVGERADERSRACARARGVDLPSRARRFEASDFERFDYVIAMDAENHSALTELAPHVEARRRIHLLRAFDPEGGADLEVPDPYYGGAGGFERVFDICDASCRGLIEHLRERLEAGGALPRSR